ncbi:MAG: YebC/PmpR family DNA-binding transcriptional regulator [Endomicrobia bacterium]|nr:YebC/PmpR family DNA-binding transcriptional regulator [Endomicrobiia bacterium]
MSGHSRWAGIKHKKMAQDAKRGKLFTKIIRELTIAAREGGGNPDNNPRLRKAIEMAKEANMPQDNIKKAIMRGTGEIPGAVYEEVVYEGYGPGGVAVIVEATTDNKNRTTSEIRKIFNQYGGSLGETGCVSWNFEQKGYITISKQDANEDELMSIVLELGAEDFKTDDEDIYEIITSPQNFESIKQELQKRYKLQQSEITMLPKTYVKLTGKEAEQILHLMDALEEHDDVKNVYANFDIPKEIMEKVEIK